MSSGVRASTSSDISHLKEELHEPDVSSTAEKSHEGPPSRRTFFTFHHLNALAVVILLSAIGLVSSSDFAFVIFSVFYVYFLSKVAFPRTSPRADPPVFGARNPILGVYVLVGAVIGVFLPIAYISEGIFKGDKERIEAAAPHLFLLASQILMEGFSFNGNFELPIRVFVPVVYNSRRIFTIADWLRSEISKVDEDYGSSAWKLYVGKALAVANMAFWCFNLFGFLLPVYLPRAFKIYYSKIKN